MKYPKVWGSGPDTARIVGEARLRGLDQVGLPHLKAFGPGFIAYKKGTTSEVHIEGGEEQGELFPYVLTHHAFTSDATYIVTLVGGERRRKYAVTSGYIDGNEWFDSTTRVVHVGGGYYASTSIYNTDPSGDLSKPHYVFGFAALLSGKSAYSTELAEDRFNKNVAFNNHAHYLDPGKSEGDPAYDPDHYPESTISLSLNACLDIFATGWDAAVGAYRFGWGLWQGGLQAKFSSPDNEKHVRTFFRIPQFYRTHTAQMQLQSTAAAYFPATMNLPSQLFSMGPGRLGYLLLPKDFQPVGVTWEQQFDYLGNPAGYAVDTYTLPDPAHTYLCVSNNHGQTWNLVEWSALSAHLMKLKNHSKVAQAGRQYRDEQTEIDAMRYAGIYYVGQGKSIIVVHYCMEDQSAVSDNEVGNFDKNNYRSMAFVYDANNPGQPTRLSWPPDSWNTQFAPYISKYSSNVLLRSFGEGCLALPMVSATGTALMVTRDFGATWSQVELLDKLPVGSSAEFIVTKPYVDAENPGELLFIFPSNGTQEDSRKGIHAYRTDGLFAEFKYVGRIVKNYAGHTVLTDEPYGKSGIYVGENKRGFKGEVEYPPYVNPAFPGEFDKP